MSTCDQIIVEVSVTPKWWHDIAFKVCVALVWLTVITEGTAVGWLVGSYSIKEAVK